MDHIRNALVGIIGFFFFWKVLCEEKKERSKDVVWRRIVYKIRYSVLGEFVTANFIHERKNMQTPDLKTGKWSEHEAAEAVKDYVAAGKTVQAVEEIAEKLKRTPRSVQGKLTSMKDENGNSIYVAPDKPTARPKQEGPTKGELETELENLGYDTTGLQSATRPALLTLRDYVAEHSRDTD